MASRRVLGLPDVIDLSLITETIQVIVVVLNVDKRL
jgi:hypothetical protein